jgi:riboflavin kinase/FMN adenylyltransferase
MAETLTLPLAEPALGPSVVAIGVFDGVHLGHQELVRVARAAADRIGVRAVVVTFDRDPDRVVTPETAAPQLLALDDKLDLLAALGPDTVIVIPFDTTVASLTPERFCAELLVPATLPVRAVVGADFRFGRGARGDVGTLTTIGETLGFAVHATKLVQLEGAPVTSTRIRASLTRGDVAEAARLMSRPHRLRGRVVHGRGRGAAIAVPTANLHFAPEAALPATGVYAARAHAEGAAYPAAVSVGPAPSFEDARDAAEAHLIGYSGDPLYGREIVLEFTDRIRGQARFLSDADLAEAIGHDIRAVIESLGDSATTSGL